MAENRDKKASGTPANDGAVRPDLNSPQAPSRALELFKSLSEEEQDEVLRWILSEGGVERLLTALGARDAPGSLEVFLGRVGYHHFLPVVKDE